MTVSAFTIDFRPVSGAEVEVPVKEVSLTSRVGEIGWLYQLRLIKCNKKLFDLSIVFSGLLKHHASSMKNYQLGPWLLSVRVRLYVFCWGVGWATIYPVFLDTVFFGTTTLQIPLWWRFCATLCRKTRKRSVYSATTRILNTVWIFFLIFECMEKLLKDWFFFCETTCTNWFVC